MTKAKKGKRERRTGQGSVYQLYDGRWRGAITFGYNESGNPKRHTVTKRTRTEAVQALNEVMIKMHLGIQVAEDKQTLAEFLDFWLREHVKDSKAPKTYRFYEQMVRNHITPALGSIPIRKLSSQHCQRFINDKMRAVRSDASGNPTAALTPRTIQAIRATLRAALNSAYKTHKLISQNPMLGVTAPRIEAKEPVYLTSNEARALIQASSDHYLGNLIRLALHTGLRLGEATGLTWGDVDFEGGQISVRQQLQRVDSKLGLRPLKTGSSRRTIVLTGDAMAALNCQKVNQVLWRSSGLEIENDLALVFTSPQGRPLDPKLVDKNLKALAAKAGIIKQVSFHKLRHTAATYLVASGVSLNIVKEILGHSQIALTANTYAHAVPAAHKEAVDLLEKAYGGREG